MKISSFTGSHSVEAVWRLPVLWAAATLCAVYSPADTITVDDIVVSNKITQVSGTVTNTFGGDVVIQKGLSVSGAMTVPKQGNISMGTFTNGISAGGASGESSADRFVNVTIGNGNRSPNSTNILTLTGTAAPTNSPVSVVQLWAETMIVTNVAGWSVAEAQKGHWRMNDNAANTTVIDDSGNGNNGTLGGGDNTATISQNPGKINRSLLLNGSDDYINIDAVVNDISSNTNGAIAIWVKPSNIDTDWTCIFTFNDTDANEFMFARQHSTAGIVQCGHRAAGVTKWVFSSDSPVLANGTWTHLILQQNGIAPVLYVNGDLVAVTFTHYADKTKWFADLGGMDNGRLGCLDAEGGGRTYYWNGQYDDVRIFDRVLTTNEIAQIYNAGNGTETNEVALVTSTNAEFRVRDSSGNVTTLSPHNTSLIPDSIKSTQNFPMTYYSRNDRLGYEMNVDMLSFIRAVEKMTGEQYIYVRRINEKGSQTEEVVTSDALIKSLQEDRDKSEMGK